MENKTTESVRKHWESWAGSFGTDLRATTKAPTLKQLEVDALNRAFKRIGFNESSQINILEVGCGNGHNLLPLSRIYSNANFVGVDYLPEMVDSANELKRKYDLGDQLQFAVGDILKLTEDSKLSKSYDIVFTDRCVINITDPKLQLKAYDELLGQVRPGGYLLSIENPSSAYANQNFLRTSGGLPARQWADYNLFLNEEEVLSHVGKQAKLVEIEDFISLHDVVLYVLLPMINGGNVDYDHPIVQAAADVAAAMNAKYVKPIGTFGQNRLYIWKKA